MLLKAALKPPPSIARPSGLFLCLVHLVPSEVRTPSLSNLSRWIPGCWPVLPPPPGSAKGTLPGLAVCSPDIQPLELMPLDLPPQIPGSPYHNPAQTTLSPSSPTAHTFFLPLSLSLVSA